MTFEQQQNLKHLLMPISHSWPGVQDTTLLVFYLTDQFISVFFGVSFSCLQMLMLEWPRSQSSDLFSICNCFILNIYLPTSIFSSLLGPLLNLTGIYHSLYLNVKYIFQIYYDPNQMSNLLAKFASPMVFLTSINSNSILRAAQDKNLWVILIDYSLTFIFHSQSFRKSCSSSLKI